MGTFLRTRALYISAPLVVLMMIIALMGNVAVFGASGTVSGDKTASPTDLACNGSTTVTLTLNGQTGIAGNPTDIMLVLDRSGSMAGTPIADLKTAADTFVDTIDQGTDGVLDGVISNGSRVGIVSFSTTATLDVPLTTNAATLKSAINALVAGGNTAIGDGINAAQAELSSSNPGSNKVMILFTDGQSNTGSDPSTAAANARAAGTVIYAIGLGNGVNVAALDDYATDPDATHVFLAPSSSDLQSIFSALGAAIVVPAATNVTVVDTVNNHFSVSSPIASKGTVTQSGDQLTWTIAQLNTETVTLTYTAAHDPTTSGGVEAVNDSVTYSDTEGNSVTFPSPKVNVHGCAATIDLTPATATNELGTPGQTHTVTATVSDDFGDPVPNVAVDFSILSGPNAGGTGNGTTDAAGQTPYTYTATQGLAGLGTDVIQACFTNAAGNAVCVTATKDWVDTTPPSCNCTQAVNPSGNKVPQAPGNGGQGQNQDGFYQLTASDAVDPNPSIYVVDTGSGTVFGPFANGTVIKYTQAPGATPSQQLMGGPNSAVQWHITGTGDANVYAIDASGNQSAPVACLVPPPPQ